MSVEDGLRLIAERSRLMQGVKRHGKMAWCLQRAIEWQRKLQRRVERRNRSLEWAGEYRHLRRCGAVEKLVAKFTADGVQVKLLNVSHAFHSPLMDEMLDAFEAFAAKIEYRVPQVPLARISQVN